MPSITIRERDLTSAGNLDATTNAVYIPGYSNMGPTNQPIACETLEDFQLIFGSEPYKFREPQAWPEAGKTENGKDMGITQGDYTNVGFDTNSVIGTMGKFYEAGELEKSYIMAAELLKLGIPVLYERKFNDGDWDKTYKRYANRYNWTASASLKNVSTSTAAGEETEGTTILANIEATSPGLVSKDIYFIITKSKVKVAKDDNGPIYGGYYSITVGRESNVALSTSKISPVTTKFTFDSKVAALLTDCKMVYSNQTLEDNSGLIKIKFNIVGTDDTYTIFTNGVKGNTQTLEFPDDSKIMESDKYKDEFTVKDMYVELLSTGTTDKGEQLGFSKLLDKGEYVVKFITSGAYPVFEFHNSIIAQKMVEVAANRGDCTALIDHTPNNERTLLALNDASVYAKVIDWADTYVVNSLGEDAFTYAAMFTPYGVYNCTTVNKQVMLPASHGYLSALAASVQTNGNWMAAAGVQRGAVPNLVSLCQNLTNAIADSYEPRDGISINPITNIKPYGLTIWGNRTLKNNAKKGDLTATSFLSIRQLTNDVKRTVWVAAKTLTFEQNSDILWINFKSKIIPTLDQMVSGSGLSGYEIKKQKTTKKATVKAVIRLYAIEPVEDWDITIELADSSTEIAG